MKAIVTATLLPFALLADGFSVYIGTNDFLLSFADTDLTMSAKTNIMMDLQHEYSSLTNLPTILHENESHGRIQFMAYGISPYEDRVRLPFTYSIDPMTGVRNLAVKKDLSDKYMQAFSLWNSNSNVVVQGFGFVDSLRNGLLTSMASNEVGQVFFWEHATGNELEASLERLSHFLDNLTILDPGFLSLFVSMDDHPGGGEGFVMAIPCIDHCDGGRHDVVTAIWIDGKWKLLLGE